MDLDAVTEYEYIARDPCQVTTETEPLDLLQDQGDPFTEFCFTLLMKFQIPKLS